MRKPLYDLPVRFKAILSENAPFYNAGDWMEGFPVILYDEHDRPYAAIQLTDGRHYLVDTKTISEKTGLTDSDGTPIYENDIVKFSDGTWKFKARVIYVDGMFSLEKGKDPAAYDSIYIPVYDYIASGWTLKVVGNYYDKKVR